MKNYNVMSQDEFDTLKAIMEESPKVKAMIHDMYLKWFNRDEKTLEEWILEAGVGMPLIKGLIGRDPFEENVISYELEDIISVIEDMEGQDNIEMFYDGEKINNEILEQLVIHIKDRMDYSSIYENVSWDIHEFLEKLNEPAY